MIYGILPHKYDIIRGIFPKYLKNIKNINNTFQHKFIFAWFYRRQPLNNNAQQKHGNLMIISLGTGELKRQIKKDNSNRHTYIHT